MDLSYGCQNKIGVQLGTVQHETGTSFQCQDPNAPVDIRRPKASALSQGRKSLEKPNCEKHQKHQKAKCLSYLAKCWVHMRQVLSWQNISNSTPMDPKVLSILD